MAKFAQKQQMPIGTPTYNKLFGAANEKALCQQTQKYPIDLINKDLPEDVIVVDRADLHKTHHLSNYIKSAEALLLRLITFEDEETRRIFMELIINTQPKEFEHIFNLDKNYFQFLEGLQNQDNCRNLSYLANTNYIYALALEMRTKYNINGSYPTSRDLVNVRTKNGISQARELCSDFTIYKTQDLVATLRKSRDAFGVGGGLNYLTTLYANAGSSDFMIQFSKDLTLFANKVAARASLYTPAVGLGDLLSPFDPRNGTITCGNYIIDEQLGGLEKDGVHIIGSLSGAGKTQEICLIALEAILKTGKKVLMVTPESDAGEIYSRLYAYLILGYNFELLNKGLYNLETCNKLKDLISQSALFTYIKERLFLIDQDAIPVTSDASIKDKTALFNKIIATKKEHDVDIIFIDSYYQFSDDISRYNATSEFLLLAKQILTPIVLSTQMKPLGGKGYADKETTHFDSERFSGGNRVVYPASWVYGVFKVTDEDSGRTKKKYIIHKRRQATHTDAVVFTNCLAGMGDYSCMDMSSKNNELYKTNLSYIFEKSIEMQGLSPLLAEVRRLMSGDQRTQEVKKMSLPVLDFIGETCYNTGSGETSVLHRADVSSPPCFTSLEVEGNVGELSVIPEHAILNNTSKDFLSNTQDVSVVADEIVYTEDDFHEMLRQKIEANPQLAVYDFVTFDDDEVLVFKNSGNMDVYDLYAGALPVVCVKHYLQNKVFMYPEELELFYKNIEEKETLSTVVADKQEGVWQSDLNRERLWDNTHTRQFEPDKQMAEIRLWKNRGISYITKNKVDRDYSSGFSSFAKMKALDLGEVDVELSNQVDKIKRLQQDNMQRKKFKNTDLTKEEKSVIIEETAIFVDISQEKLAEAYNYVYQEDLE